LAPSAGKGKSARSWTALTRRVVSFSGAMNPQGLRRAPSSSTLACMNRSPARGDASRLIAVLGPTNTGKTHLAVERMLGHSSGMIGLPLRLLAREIYDRVVKARGAAEVALITGEEKIVPLRPRYFVCTVEAMPLDRRVDFLAVDEIQLCADPERGHVFTHRLLHAWGSSETMLMGATTVASLIRQLCPDAEIQFRERLSELSYAGPKKVTRLPRRSAIVAFSTDAVYAIAELIRRQRGGAAVVMGSLSPRTRNAQVSLFQSGEVDFLVATDAIGMGLNMDVDHVAFAGLRKFDGRRLRGLYSQEIAQIAGRAGRFRKDGAFGVTGDAPDLDPDVVAAVEGHVFPAVMAAEWRNHRLDFQSLQGLIRSLAASPPASGLRLSEEAQDETTLRQLSTDEMVMRRTRDRSNLMRLWEVCQTPDFRKVTQDEHARLIGTMFEHLTQGDRRLPEDWMQGQFASLDRTDGDIDALSSRLARVRTLAYVANRSDWLADPQTWQGRARGLEDRLSDTLHQSLMQRFVDRRTSALLRSLNQRAGPILGGIDAEGAVTVEGHLVGRLAGFHFEAERGETALENRALRGAVERVVAPEVARQLGALASEGDEAFALAAGGIVNWRGEAAGEIVGGEPFAPRVRLIGEFGAEPQRERAARRLEAFAAAEATRRLSALKHLKEAIEDGRLKGLARGLAYQLVEQFGALDRRGAEARVRLLSRNERRTLKALGVRFGAFSLYLPSLLEPEAQLLAFAYAELASPAWRPEAGSLNPLPRPAPRPQALALRGLRAVGQFAAPIAELERLDALARAAWPEGAGAIDVTEALLKAMGWGRDDAHHILRALGYARARDGDGAERAVFRRRRAASEGPASKADPVANPFAALAALTKPNSADMRRARRAKARRRRAAGRAAS
jgi:ATP-dependent RNA helicase SUPV3L1/SUV3